MRDEIVCEGMVLRGGEQGFGDGNNGRGKMWDRKTNVEKNGHGLHISLCCTGQNVMWVW